MHRRGNPFCIRVLAPFGALLALLLFASTALADPASRGLKHSFGRSSSTNWSGYAAAGSGATHVIGTWTQPAATCSPGENSWSSPWVGIDGDTSNTVEQIGTDSDCQNGTPVYYAWYEMYPKSLVVVNLPGGVHANDSFTAEVTYTGSSNYLLKLTKNNSPTASFQTTQFSRKARRTSVEWIMEGPSSGLLTNFSSVTFTGLSGTINGVTGNLGTLANVDPITMVTNQGAVRALPSRLSDTSFRVDWKQH
jgi:Peptidase A4 family